MKIIINCDETDLPAALQLLQDELPGWRARYNKNGWGWHFGTTPRFFVRAVKDGLSIQQKHRRPTPIAHEEKR